MKRLFVIFSALILVTSLVIAETVEVKVKGMVCSFCAQGLDKKFRAEPAVEDVKVALKDKVIRLNLKEGKTMTNYAIEKLVKDAGYNVQSIERK